jgi:hypothetical protein
LDIIQQGIFYYKKRDIRQKILNELIEKYKKKYDVKKSVLISLEKELEIYNSTNSKNHYWKKSKKFILTL